jgi:hypothetical protein
MSEAAAERCAQQERLLEERRRVLGEEHPDTLSAMLGFADCLWAQGRLIAARRLEERVVAGRRQQLGEDHFDTLKATGKLAVTMAAQGGLAEARELQERVIEGMRALFGDTGAETLRAINNLAGTRLGPRRFRDGARTPRNGYRNEQPGVWRGACRHPDGNGKPRRSALATRGSGRGLCAAAACGRTAPARPWQERTNPGCDRNPGDHGAQHRVVARDFCEKLLDVCVSDT